MESKIQQSNSFTNTDSTAMEKRPQNQYQDTMNNSVNTGFPRIEQALHETEAATEAFKKLELVSGSVFFNGDEVKIKCFRIPEFQMGNIRRCTPFFIYPKSRMSGHVYLVYIQCSDFIDSDFVKNALFAKGVIGGRVSNTATDHAFLAQTAKLGQYEIRTMSGIATVFVTPYEESHVLHGGRFAIGSPRFLCGLKNEQEYQVILRGESSSNVRFVVSRSYAGDCVGLQQENGSADRKKRGNTNNQNWKTHESVNFPKEQPKTFASKSWKKTIVNDQQQLFENFFHINQQDKIPSNDSNLTDMKVNYNLCSDCGIENDKSSLYSKLGVFLMKNEAQFNLTMFPCESCEKTVFNETRFLCSDALKQVPTGANKRNNNSQEAELTKYYKQRFRLISLYTKDINLTREAWFSICPEEIAKHIAGRIASLSQKKGRKICVFDPFCGAGGNIIQVARMDEVKMVYASDLNPKEIESLKCMAKIYGVQNKVKYRVKNFFDLSPGDLTEIDAIVSSPPWGGPGYFIGKYDMATMKPSYTRILHHASQFSRNMAMLLPRNTCLDQLIRSGEQINSTAVELELNFISQRPKTITAYYGDIVNLK